MEDLKNLTEEEYLIKHLLEVEGKTENAPQPKIKLNVENDF